jgi:4-amino-4-deoxy-L-arabinose transferase-like glycosyltransferase
MHTTISANKQARYLGIFLFFFALLLRVSYVNTLEIDQPLRADAGKYVTLAFNLVTNGSYSLASAAPFQPSTYITPGYPLLLAVGLTFFNDINSFYSFILNVQALLGSVSVLLFYLIALRLMPLAYAGVASLLIVVSPHLMASTGYVLTETPFIFWLALTLWLSLLALATKKLYWFFLAGLACGWAALTRPELLLYPVIPLLVLWRFRVGTEKRKELLSLSLALLLGLALVWSPWQLWKSAHFNAEEPNLAPASFALGIYPDLIYKDPALQGYPYRDDPTYAQFSTSLSAAFAVLRERAAQEPWTYFKWYAFGKPATFWQADNNLAAAGGPFIYPVVESRYHKSPLWAYSLRGMFALHTPLVVLSFLASALALLWFIKRKPAHQGAYVCGAVLVYFTLIHSVLAALPRYSYPVIPVAYLMGIYLLSVMVALARSRLHIESQTR